MTKKTPVILCILDGWGIAPQSLTNGIHMANTPVWDQLLKDTPNTQLEASELFVGLPHGQMGNSEVGHMSIGSGRVILQDLPRIDQAIANHTLEAKQEIHDFINKTKNANNRCHLMGLLSPGGVHSHQDHIIAIAILLAKAGIHVDIHAFLDGRDTPPQSSPDYLKTLKEAIAPYPTIRLATICGRYYAMDRDKRWDRVEKAYECMANGKAGTQLADDVTDEFVPPYKSTDYNGMQDGDSLFMVNFRADRVRQILSAFLLPDFHEFPRPHRLSFAATLGLNSYSETLSPHMPALFTKESITNTLGEVVANAGLKQLRTAETEKYAHVTFFFNGGRELVYAGEDRKMIQSPKVATYDLQPEMSALELTDFLDETIRNKTYDLIVVNYANPDMVGHTGVQSAIKIAVETVDRCLGRLSKACQESGYALIVTSDHGNVEQMVEQDQPHTAHTCNPVPFLVQLPTPLKMTLEPGSLQNIAPTVLTLLDIPIPSDMTGKSLISP